MTDTKGDCRTSLNSREANTALIDCRAERDRLKAVNAELAGALEHLLHRYLFDNTEDDAAVKQARAVLAKAKREAP